MKLTQSHLKQECQNVIKIKRLLLSGYVYIINYLLQTAFVKKASPYKPLPKPLSKVRG